MRQVTRAALGIGMFFGVVALTTAGDDDAIKKALKDSEGTWGYHSKVKDGVKATKEELKDLRLVIKGNNWTVYRGNVVQVSGTRKIVAVEKGFRKAVLMTDTGLVFRNIAKVEGDTFTTCRAPEGDPHPKQFTSKGNTLTVYKRVKK